MRYLPVLILIHTSFLFGQTPAFHSHDTIFGSITPERAWWDVHFYHLEVKVDPENKWIEGKNTIHYTVLHSDSVMQIDLRPPLQIQSFIQDGEQIEYYKKHFSYFVKLKKPQNRDENQILEVRYEGHPHVSEQPPWSGGMTWAKDSLGNHFVANSNQTDGASMWWPLKDHPSDEPDSMLISINTPEGLTAVSNGRLRKTENHPDGRITYHWFVANPINTYGVNLSIGDYAHFTEKFSGEKGTLDCDFYVLKNHLDLAKDHFQDALRMLEAFEYWFGPYPFYEDGYKLVEVPYLGMEHQSCVTYGNQYMKGYLGRDLSSSGWGLKFDFIIIHESAHEWWANNITYADLADMWIHESFTSYSESLFVEYFYGKKAGGEYVRGLRPSIVNDRPIQGVYGVSYPGSKDMYYKGANMWNTLRQIVNDDDHWREILRGLNKEFYHKTVLAADIENYINQNTEVDLTSFFEQYVRDYRLPVFTYWIDDNQLKYRFDNVTEGFSMPVKIKVDEKFVWLKDASDAWNSIPLSDNVTIDHIIPDPDFYMASFPLTSGK